MADHRQYTRYKSDTPPIRIAVNVDPHIKNAIERCAKSRDVSMNKVINEILEKSIPDLEAQSKVFENPDGLAPQKSEDEIFGIDFPEVEEDEL